MQQMEEVVAIKHLKKFFDNTVVFNDLSFTIHRGEVIVIVGPSGCGKSTLLRCINGLEPIQSGEIFLDGQPMPKDKAQWSQVRRKVGMVFQSYDLFPHMKVIDNVLLGPIKVQKRTRKEAEKAAEALLARVGLLHKKDSYPRQLSGGEKQRVAIVRALMMEPEIMLFDEVTAALDPEMVREVLDVILELAKGGMTMIIVTHEMAFARAIADRIIFMDGGEIIEENSPNEFFSKPKTQRASKFLNIFNFSEERGYLP